MPRQPRIKTQQRNYLVDGQPVSTAYYYWPPEGRGRRIVDETMYKRCVELLLHLDFATLEKAISSTTRWVAEVAMGSDWRLEIVGRRSPPPPSVLSSSAAGRTVNDLSGLVKRKRSATADGDTTATTAALAPVEPLNKVNTLGPGLVRKKNPGEGATAVVASGGLEEPRVNVLDTGLIRKKPKVQ